MTVTSAAGYPVTMVIGSESPRLSRNGKHADDIFMAGFNAALDAVERASVAILQGTWRNTIRREDAAAGLLHFADAAREAMASNDAPSENHAVVVAPAARMFAVAPKLDRANTRAAGYSGDACDTCGSLSMKRVGSCLTRDACGTTTGCS